VNLVAVDAAKLEQAYEALRAQATGQLAATTPRGLALFLARGLPSWLVAWTAPVLVPAPRQAPAASISNLSLAGLSAELVNVLAAMVLGAERRYCT